MLFLEKGFVGKMGCCKRMNYFMGTLFVSDPAVVIIKALRTVVLSSIVYKQEGSRCRILGTFNGWYIVCNSMYQNFRQGRVLPYKSTSSDLTKPRS